MILSPALSWLLIGWVLAVIVTIAFFYGASERRHHHDRLPPDWIERNGRKR